MNVIIIGGGASGLTAAIACAKHHHVKIIERNPKCGKKLLLTGNGHCNFWNEDQTIEHYHSQNKTNLQTILNQATNFVLPFFESLGIIAKKKNGYYYPMSNQAISILNALTKTAERMDVEFLTDTYVKEIQKEEKFTIITSKKTYIADAIILATGSKACSKTGSDGNGYELAKKLGHHIIDVLPSLVQIKGTRTDYKDWEGVRTDVTLTLMEKNTIRKVETGELQCTNYGISGICVYNLSGLVAQGLHQGTEEKILINFAPWFQNDKKSFAKWLQEQSLEKPISDVLDGFLNYKLGNYLQKIANIKKDTKKEQINFYDLASLILEFPFEVKETNGFENAQVCSGGIPLDEINPETMESKIVKNLYLVGELLDVNGDCGGYNLGFAWMSGLIAGSKVGHDSN